MDLPENVIKSRLYGTLTKDQELLSILQSVREVVDALAVTTDRTVPNYTDHTVKHMDALWGIADQIFTVEESNRLTPAEAFLLGVSFYLHDVGMAYAATPEGLNILKSSEPFNSFMASIPEAERELPSSIARAVAISVRRLHGDAARELAIKEIPGSEGVYIFQAKTVRDAWGTTCGEIASSHHWSIAQLESHFGRHGGAPLPGGRRADLLYVSSCLRLVDYAHINRERASTMARAFRFPLGADSLVHWLAQEHIDGPLRDEGAYLVYRAAKPIGDVEAWWLFYEMMSGLDAEIRGVTRILDQRQASYKRLSLRGVRGATSPDDAAAFIPPLGFLPIEVNLRTGSIDKLVELLAGETLYGPNPMAAIRELIQNARDAVMLKSEVAIGPADKAALSLPITINLTTTGSTPLLEVIDYGIGMTKLVITDYLISIASNYWTTQFANDFPDLATKGFKSAGKFGIGFLSVFMLGEEVSVESNRLGGDRYRLSLRGVGRRGELQKVQSPSGSGTSVQIKIKPQALDHIKNLDKLIPIYAPTLPHDLRISIDDKQVTLQSGWISVISCEELQVWCRKAARILTQRSDLRPRGDSDFPFRMREKRVFSFLFLPAGSETSNPWRAGWPQYVDGKTRLIASIDGLSILSLRGLAIEAISTPGFAGIIELESITTDVSRSRALNADVTAILNLARNGIAPHVIKNLEELSKSDLMVNLIGFVATCVDLYGKNVVQNSEISWISQITMPGNVELINCATLLSRLSQIKSVFLAFNLGPWTAMKKWAEAGSQRDPGEIAIVLADDGQRGAGYLSSAVAIGSLEEIWENSSDSVLFSTLIDIVAQAWQISPSVLLQQPGWSHEGSHVFGRFVRK